jgi:adenosylcobinamide-GDP ribazoletransferase
MGTVRGAFGLLTRLPVGAVVPDRPGAAAFGVVGAVVGAVGAVPLVLLAGPVGEPWLGAIAAVALITLTTGALHLDGLADTTDALLAGDRDAAERARKDPAVGPGGATGLMLALGAEVAALASLGGSGAAVAGVSLVAVGATSRVVPVVATRLVPSSGDGDGAGLGRWFSDRTSTGEVIVALLSAAVVVVGVSLVTGLVDGAAAGGVAVAAGAGIGALIGLAATFAIAPMRGRLDGDGFGASIEISMAVGLVATAALVA